MRVPAFFFLFFKEARGTQTSHPCLFMNFRCFGVWAMPAPETVSLNAEQKRVVMSELKKKNKSKLSTTDLLVPASMKNAAKCDK